MRLSAFTYFFLLLLAGGCYDIHADPEGYYENEHYYYRNGGSGKGNLENGEKVGPWTFWNAGRVVVGKGDFVGDKMNGIWELFYDSGAKKSRGTFADNIRNGFWQFWREDGSQESQGSFRTDLREGDWTWWYSNGKLMSRGQMHDDRRSGAWEFWYPDGSPKEVRVYKNGLSYLGSSRRADGSQMVVGGTGTYEYWEGNVLLERGQYQDSLATGAWEFYDANGELKQRVQYIAGVEQ